MQESLRIRPPVGLLARWAPSGTTLAGYDTSDKVLLVSPYVQHMDHEVWGPDAAEFRPERWLEEARGPALTVPPYSYMPFSRGPRNCIGAQFALLEAKTILSMVLRWVAGAIPSFSTFWTFTAALSPIWGAGNRLLG